MKNNLRTILLILLMVLSLTVVACTKDTPTKKDIEITVTSAVSGVVTKTYSGEPQTLTARVTLLEQPLAGLTLTYSYSGKGDTTYAASSTAPTNVGTYTVAIAFAGNDSYNAKSITVDLTITKLAPVLVIACESIFAGTTDVLTPSVVSNTSDNSNVTYSFEGRDGTTYAANPTAPTAIGKYKVTASVAATSNCEAATSEAVNFEIFKSQAAAPVSAPVLIVAYDDVIFLDENSDLEYRIESGEWQTSNVFDGLASSTSYQIYSRFAATATHSASLAGPVLTVKTCNGVIMDGFESTSYESANGGGFTTSTEKAHNGDSSMKATLSGGNNNLTAYQSFVKLYNDYTAKFDISAYDSIAFWIYAAGEADSNVTFTFSLTHTWTPIYRSNATTIPVNTWTKVVYSLHDGYTTEDMLPTLLNLFMIGIKGVEDQVVYVDDFSLIYNDSIQQVENSNLISNFDDGILTGSKNDGNTTYTITGLAEDFGAKLINAETILIALYSDQKMNDEAYYFRNASGNIVLSYTTKMIVKGVQYISLNVDLGLQTDMNIEDICTLEIVNNVSTAEINENFKIFHIAFIEKEEPEEINIGDAPSLPTDYTLLTDFTDDVLKISPFAGRENAGIITSGLAGSNPKFIDGADLISLTGTGSTTIGEMLGSAKFVKIAVHSDTAGYINVIFSSATSWDPSVFRNAYMDQAVVVGWQILTFNLDSFSAGWTNSAILISDVNHVTLSSVSISNAKFYIGWIAFENDEEEGDVIGDAPALPSDYNLLTDFTDGALKIASFAGRENSGKIENGFASSNPTFFAANTDDLIGLTSSSTTKIGETLGSATKIKIAVHSDKAGYIRVILSPTSAWGYGVFRNYYDYVDVVVGWQILTFDLTLFAEGWANSEIALTDVNYICLMSLTILDARFNVGWIAFDGEEGEGGGIDLGTVPEVPGTATLLTDFTDGIMIRNELPFNESASIDTTHGYISTNGTDEVISIKLADGSLGEFLSDKQTLILCIRSASPSYVSVYFSAGAYLDGYTFGVKAFENVGSDWTIISIDLSAVYKDEQTSISDWSDVTTIIMKGIYGMINLDLVWIAYE